MAHVQVRHVQVRNKARPRPAAGLAAVRAAQREVPAARPKLPGPRGAGGEGAFPLCRLTSTSAIGAGKALAYLASRIVARLAKITGSARHD